MENGNLYLTLETEHVKYIKQCSYGMLSMDMNWVFVVGAGMA